MITPTKRLIVALGWSAALLNARSSSAEFFWMPELSVNSPTEPMRTFSGGGGLLFSTDLFSFLAVESGAEYVRQGIAGGGVTHRFNSIQMPLALRFVGDVFSFGAGAYGQMSLEGRALIYGVTTHIEYGVTTDSAHKGWILRLAYLQNLAIPGVFNSLVLCAGYRF